MHLKRSKFKFEFGSRYKVASDEGDCQNVLSSEMIMKDTSQVYASSSQFPGEGWQVCAHNVENNWRPVTCAMCAVCLFP